MKSKEKIAVIIALFLCVISLIGMTIVLIGTSTPTLQSFIPPEFDTNAMPGTPEVPNDLGWEVLNTDIFSTGICGKITTEQSAAVVWFTNPQSNNVWLKLRILDADGNLLGESGLITPGQYIETVGFSMIPQTDTSIAIKIMAYEPDTYHSAGSMTLYTQIVIP